MKYTYDYPRPAVTVDMIIFKKPCCEPEILLIKRLKPPFQDQWALPGGFVDMDETLEQAAAFLDKGFSIIKLKGGLNLDEDIEKILKLREKMGDEFCLRYDANQGYSSAESIEFIKKTKS